MTESGEWRRYFPPVVPGIVQKDLAGRLPDEEQAAGEQDQVAPRDLVADDGEHRRRQADHPGEHEQQRDAHEHGERETQAPRELAARRRQAVHQDGDEDDVVDAQHQLERGERGKGDPGLRVEQQFHLILVNPARRGPQCTVHALLTRAA